VGDPPPALVSLRPGNQRRRPRLIKLISDLLFNDTAAAAAAAAAEEAKTDRSEMIDED